MTMTTQRSMMMFGCLLAAGAGAGCLGNDSAPATCKDAKATYEVSTDGPQTLYFGGDKSMPWSAYCVGMASDSPLEFLELPPFDASGRPANFAGFIQADSPPRGDTLEAPRDGFSIITRYDKVRIDPVDLTIDITNKTYTRTDAPLGTSGSLVSRTLGNMEISYMPYGAAMQCGHQVSIAGLTVKADASIDLSGLPFELVDEQLCTTAGNNSVVKSSANPTKVVAFHAEGVTSGDIMTCGRASVRCLPDPTTNGQVGGQSTIALRYAASLAR
jgi:hypothetical protein